MVAVHPRDAEIRKRAVEAEKHLKLDLVADEETPWVEQSDPVAVTLTREISQLNQKVSQLEILVQRRGRKVQRLKREVENLKAAINLLSR